MKKIKRPKTKGKGYCRAAIAALLLVGCADGLNARSVADEGAEYLTDLCARLDSLPPVGIDAADEKIAHARLLCGQLLKATREITPELEKLANEVLDQ